MIYRLLSRSLSVRVSLLCFALLPMVVLAGEPDGDGGRRVGLLSANSSPACSTAVNMASGVQKRSLDEVAERIGTPPAFANHESEDNARLLCDQAGKQPESAEQPDCSPREAADEQRAKSITFPVKCEGTYPHHLQGICVGQKAVYWSFTTTLVKTDLHGKLLKKVAVANHHGDLCFHDGRLYVAVNLGKFNDPKGNADSWVYVYDADTLKELNRHETQEVFHGAGGIGYRSGHFFVVGGLPDGIEENYIYEYDEKFQFLKKHVLKSGHTHLGIQTATYAYDRWWFGCYGEPKILLVADSQFELIGRYPFDCSLGIVGLPYDQLMSASGRCDKETGCIGSVQLVVPDDESGLVLKAAN